MKKRITFVIIVILGLLNNVFVNSSTIVVDVEITFNTLTLEETGDNGEGEIWFKIINSAGITVYEKYFGDKNEGTYENIGISKKLYKYFEGDSLFIEVWDADPGADDLLFEGELYIKNSGPRTVEYSNMQFDYEKYYGWYTQEYFLVCWPDDRTYATFDIYGCSRSVPYEGWAWDYYGNNLSIDVSLRYYYSNIT
ncbi:MAG: hypothetical protein K9W46_14505 [Candidatus Heimdallarchaeum endolithica]|uniref:Uncharacterized protein n=1 Tax=Candidatus Heimdallarchaeum endolithica TaxID=2876572 RepID=A0A9Y1BRD7_9ARCH|nr:MAG: hypothetical protein K9W46_14505 [Candidatus Heimdallarchaeum endolithica]